VGGADVCGADGKRRPSQLELEVAETQGKAFYGVVEKAFRG
jgi:hypothetical protein